VFSNMRLVSANMFPKVAMVEWMEAVAEEEE
jgi:hypothetical protein